MDPLIAWRKDENSDSDDKPDTELMQEPFNLSILVHENLHNLRNILNKKKTINSLQNEASF